MRRRWFWILVIAVILIAGGVTAGRLRAPKAAPPAPVEEAVPVEVASVERGTVEHTVEISGTLTSGRMAEVLPRRSGLVTRVLVSEGARVTRGQPLVLLDSAEAAVRVRQAQAAVAAAEARVALLTAGARPQERAQVEEAVRQAESALAGTQTQYQLAVTAARTAETNLQRMEALLRDGAVSQSQVDQARLEVDRAEAQVRSAEAQVRAAEAQLRSARQSQSLVEAGPRSEDIRAARAQLEQARALLAEARQVLSDTVVRAPFAGRVAQLEVSPGDFAAAGESRGAPVAVVYDEEALEAEVTVGEREAALIRLGQGATLRPEIAAGRLVGATVKTVTPLADVASRAVTVHLRLLPGNMEGLLPGTFVRGAIVVEQRAGVLTVPRAALRDEGGPVLWVVRDGSVDVRRVTTGLTTGNRVQVTSGVRAGEQVITLGPERIAQGARVKIVAPGRR